MSGNGVIFLNLVRTLSKQAGVYLSNNMTRLDFSAGIVRVSIHDDTAGFHPKSWGFMYKIPARETEN